MSDTRKVVEVQAELLETAWGLIANANEGNWDKATDEWRDAAIRWREKYHAAISASEEATSA